MKKQNCLALLTSLICFLGITTIKAQITVSGSPVPTSIAASTATIAAPDLSIVSSDPLVDFTVSITDSYSNSDALSYMGGLPSGVTTTGWNPNTRSIIFKGTKTAEEWQAFLRNVTLTTGSVCSPETRKVSFVAGETFYNPINGHFYRLTDAISSWTSAESTASSTSYYGREGYLVTLTNAAENTFVSRLVGENSWMGASDDYQRINNAVGYDHYANQSAAEGKFYWVTGPEKGTQLTTTNGNTGWMSGVYHNWRNGEPNNSGTEHYGHVYATAAGDWNDFPNSINIKGIMEFGDMPGDQTAASPQFTQNISIMGAPSGSITGGNVTVCSGTNSTVLTLSGLVGTVQRWESSTDNFITAGTSISNTSNSLTVSNLSETRYYRAVVNSTSPSACTGLVTSSTPIYVEEANAGNVFAQNTTVCTGSEVKLYVSGHNGVVQKWQRSTDNANWTDISITTTTFNETISTTGSYYYRVFVQVPGCGSPMASASKQITAISGSAPVGGEVSSAQEGSVINSGTVTLTGHTGSISRWQKSTDGGIIWSDIANTGTSNAYSNITTDTQFRAVLTNGSCGIAYSDVGSVTILSTPIINSFSPDIAGNGDTITILGTGFTGTDYVSFGGTPAQSFTVISDTELTARVGAGTSGSITLTNSAGSDSAPGFIYKVAQYDFEGDVDDGTENNHDGTEIGIISFGTGAQGEAICFDKNSPGFVKLPDNLIRNLSEFTISLRFKTTDTGSILGYQNANALSLPSNYIPILMITNDGKLKGTLWTSANNAIQAVSASAVNDGNWHQVDFTAGTNTVSIYLDGALEATTTGASVAHLDMAFNQLGLAYTNGYNTVGTSWEYFEGCIDDLVIMDIALTQAEIEEVTELPEPTIISFTPTEGGKDDTIVISGTNFEGATQVTMGGSNAASFTVDASNQITAVIAGGNSGDITVTTAGGTALKSGFTFLDTTAPSGYTASIDQISIHTSNQTNASFTFAGAEVGSTYQYTFTSNGGGTPVTGSGTVATGLDEITGIDLGALSDGTITLSVTLTDSAGNVGNATLDSVTKDTVTETPTLESPETGGISGTSLVISYSLPEAALANSLELVFTAMDGSHGPIILQLQDTGTIGQPVSFTVDPENLTASAAVLSATSNTLLLDVSYNVTFSYQDAFGNPIGSVINTNHRYQPLSIVTARIFSDNPSPEWAKVGDRVVVEFVLNQELDNGSVTLMGTTLMLDGSTSVAPNTYQAWVEVTDISEEGPVVWSLSATAGTDTATTTAVSDGSSVVIDTTPPQPSLLIAESLYFGPFSMGLQFSETVTNMAPNPIMTVPTSSGQPTANLGSLKEITPGAVYSIDVTPLEIGEIVFFNDMHGIARDLAGNDALPLGFVGGTFFDLDTDNDGIGDSTDVDDDNDGTPDTEDAFPKDSNEDTDTDGDGQGDNADNDDDGDGTPDGQDDFPKNPDEDTDTDSDGIGDNFDEDDDGDGTLDTEDEFPINPFEDTDTDGDGQGDNSDDDIDGDGIPNDEDIYPKGNIIDTDNDGVPDADDTFPNDPGESVDSDGDGQGDNADTDDDNDGTPDTEDAFPWDSQEHSDTDGDGIGNGADTDDDGDGVNDDQDAFPYDASESVDTDGDGLGDNLDEDDDNDGITDGSDFFPTNKQPSLAPAEAFTPNEDGINDAWVVPGIDNYPNNTVKIYNRWGHEVFSVHSYHNNWRGFYKDNREKLPSGSYLYVIDLGNGSKPLQGWLFINY